LGEPMLNNCGPSGSPPNTGATAMGEDQDDLDLTIPGIKELCEIICECDRHLDAVQAGRTEKAACQKLGEQKHDCVNDGVNLHNSQGKTPKLQTEQGYNEATGAAAPAASRKWPRGATPEQYFRGIAGKIFPDGAILNADGKVDRFVEYKFEGPRDTPTWPRSKKAYIPSKGGGNPGWTPATKRKPDQKTRTKELGMKQNPKVTKDPVLMTPKNCKCKK